MRQALQRFLRGLRPGAGSGALPGPQKRVWRISEGTPAGEWVDPDARPVVEPAASEPRESYPSGWLASSMDLLGGAEVVEYTDAPASAAPASQSKPLSRT